MRRREFITLLGGAVAWPLAAGAQQDKQLRHVGMLVNGPEADAEMMARVAAFKKVMQDLGWVLGTNLQLDIRYGVNDDELRENAKELVALNPDVIMGMAPPSVIALLRSQLAQSQLFSRRLPIPLAWELYKILLVPEATLPAFLLPNLALVQNCLSCSRRRHQASERSSSLPIWKTAALRRSLQQSKRWRLRLA